MQTQRGWASCCLVLVFGRSGSPVLPRVRAVSDYVWTTAPGDAPAVLRLSRPLHRSEDAVSPPFVAWIWQVLDRQPRVSLPQEADDLGFREPLLHRPSLFAGPDSKPKRYSEVGGRRSLLVSFGTSLEDQAARLIEGARPRILFIDPHRQLGESGSASAKAGRSIVPGPSAHGEVPSGDEDVVTGHAVLSRAEQIRSAPSSPRSTRSRPSQ